MLNRFALKPLALGTPLRLGVDHAAGQGIQRPDAAHQRIDPVPPEYSIGWC
jgi:hypothetical protein